MRSHTTRSRLVLPLAAVLTLGLVGVPHNPGAAMTVPRLTEVAAVRLQAEVSSLVTEMAGVVDATAPAAAASSLAGTGAAAATCTYPCTVFDKFLWNLPVDVRNAILPPLYAFAWVLGLVLAPVVLVTSALFGWPVSLRPAAASAPEASPAPAEVTTAPGDRLSPKADPGTPRRPTPSSAPGNTGGDGGAAVQIPAAGGDDDEPRGRAHRSTAPTTIPLTDLDSPESAAPVVKDSATVAAATRTAARPASTADALAPAISAAEEAAPAAPRSTRPRSRSPEARSSDSGSAPKRAATRSAR